MAGTDGILYSRNKRNNTYISIILLLVSIVSVLFPLPRIIVPVVNVTIWMVVQTVGLGWIAWGLWKRKLGR